MIPPILDLLNTAFGFQGAPGARATALAAPQAQLISAIAQGVLGGNLDWGLIGIGAGIGVVVVIIDEVLRADKRGALPPLAVGMGIYLPMALTLLIPIGALLGCLYDKWAARVANPEFAQRMGVLLATGLIVGESLFGVVFAGHRRGDRQDAPLARGRRNSPGAIPLGIMVFVGCVARASMRGPARRRRRTTTQRRLKRLPLAPRAAGARSAAWRRLRPRGPARRSRG